MMKAFLLSFLLIGCVDGTVDTTCRRFRDIYPTGKELCEIMWNEAFVYDTNESNAYTMWFFDGSNPNDAISQGRGLLAQNAQPDDCQLQYFHKQAPGPEGDGFTECHPWKDHACCNSPTVESYQHLKEGYGAEYHWDRCGPLSQECERFFVQEACFYECEPNAGYFKKYADGGPDGDNHWQMWKMPIKASYCDAWWTACADDLFCGAGDYFACAREYVVQASQAVNTGSSDDGISGGVIAVIVAGGVLLLVACGMLGFFIVRERAGRPIFAPLMEKQASPGSGGQSIGNSAA